MNHLGDRVSPLIDGQLAMDASERAMTHMASCPSCQEAADLERLTKQRLASMALPQPGTEFMQRLLTLGVSDGPMPPMPGGPSGSALTPHRSSLPVSMPASPPVSRPPSGQSTRPPGRRTMLAESRPPGIASGAARRLSGTARSRLAFAAAGAACLVGVGVASGVAAAPRPSRELIPPVDTFVVQHSAATPSSPFGSQGPMFGLTGAGH